MTLSTSRIKGKSQYCDTCKAWIRIRKDADWQAHLDSPKHRRQRDIHLGLRKA